MKVKTLLLLALGVTVGLIALQPAQAAADSGLRIYVDNYGGTGLSVISMKTMKVIKTIPTGYHTHGLDASPDGRYVYVTVETDHTLKEIDAATGKVIKNVHLSGKPNEMAMTPNGKYMAVPIRTGGVVDVFSAPDLKLLKAVPVGEPHNCVSAGSNDYLFCEDRAYGAIDKIDVHALKVVQTVATNGDPRPFAVTHDMKTAFVQCSDLHGFQAINLETGAVRTVVFPWTNGKNLVEPNTPSHGMSISPDGKQLWLSDSLDHAVWVYDIAAKKLLRKVAVATTPLWITFTPDGKYCVIDCPGSDDTCIVNT
ncbi:MAG: YncE family protein, partial [Terriglobia bacterium]